MLLGSFLGEVLREKEKKTNDGLWRQSLERRVVSHCRLGVKGQEQSWLSWRPDFNSISWRMYAIAQLEWTNRTMTKCFQCSNYVEGGASFVLKDLSFQSWKGHKTTANAFLTSVPFKAWGQSCFVLNHKIWQLPMSPSLCHLWCPIFSKFWSFITVNPTYEPYWSSRFPSESRNNTL